ncbi:hypothetical protein B0H63DRAFT_455308 [Podospora didyma]|uniref:Wax synthase domain-containing protein n=1 Tax=Podospora didyma TaxID=330526 RepID=A0AAE0K2N4_9PEZI|nr:hypothetical protein B0H63DRAFT_455308 [Podospora didyma]
MPPLTPFISPLITANAINNQMPDPAASATTPIVPWVGSRPNPLDILPFILFYLALLFACAPPPFRGRGILFFALIATLQWRCIVSPWPPNESDTRPLRYGIGNSWIFALPAVERLLVNTPERDFWHVDGDDPVQWQIRQKPTPKEFTWKKVWWAMTIWATPRGVGWNFGWKRLNAQRARIRAARLDANRKTNDCVEGTPTGGRAEFVAVHLARIFVAYLCWDAVTLAEQKAIVPTAWAWDPLTIGRIMLLEVMMVIVVYAGMVMQFGIGAVAGVGLFLSDPEDWPPLFGSLFDCYKISNVWGRFWHQYLRQPCLGFSHYLVQKLHIPPRSLLAYFTHLMTAFAIADLVHVLSIGSVIPGYMSLRDLISDMSIFFLLQPLATIAEAIVIMLWNKYMQPKLIPTFNPETQVPMKPAAATEGDSAQSSQASSSTQVENMPLRDWKQKSMPVLVTAMCRLVGYIWVLCWFTFTGWWFIKAYADVGMADWKMPFSILEKLLIPGK